MKALENIDLALLPVRAEREITWFLLPFVALWKLLSLVLTISGEGDRHSWKENK